MLRFWALAMVGLLSAGPALAQRMPVSKDEQITGLAANNGDGSLGDARMDMDTSFALMHQETLRRNGIEKVCATAGCTLLVNRMPGRIVSVFARGAGAQGDDWGKDLFKSWHTALPANQVMLFRNEADPRFCNAQLRLVVELKGKVQQTIDGPADLCSHPGQVSQVVATMPKGEVTVEPSK